VQGTITTGAAQVLWWYNGLRHTWYILDCTLFSWYTLHCVDDWYTGI